MALVLKNRVKVTSTSTGTGTFELGSAVTGYQDFGAISATSNAWNISTASYSGVNFRFGTEEATPTGLFFKPDGLKMYVVGSTGDDVNEYNLSVAWDVTTATYLQTKSVAAQDTSPEDVFFKPDGLKMYVIGAKNDAVYEYDLSSAWNISTATYVTSKSISAQETGPVGLFFKPDGLKMYIVGTVSDAVIEYDLSSAWQVSSATFLQQFSISAQEPACSALFFKSDGLKMYVLGRTTPCKVFEYTLSSAWNVSTASYVQSFTTFADEAGANGLFFKSDGTQLYVSGLNYDAVFEYYIGAAQTYYCITDGVDWEVGLGTCLSGVLLERTQLFGSSNSGALVNWGAGDKEVFCGYPSGGTPGGVPYFDDSDINTDLSGWSTFQAALQSGVTGGVTYGNNSINGVVSTYSLVYTAAGNYRGGVLASNGDVHFVPANSSTTGQKINSVGVVSTYATLMDGYFGGVLAPNGDVTFLPVSSNKVQKVSAAGVVSTYSLVYSTSAGYNGGVLAPDGYIHLIPYYAEVGQKISPAGVSSTYSLVYTRTVAYNGGVLDPNGSIHFIPFDANRGQKVSAAGVVSTYSLVYTAGRYNGGVLAPNGDIHFVPYSAPVGQKVSASGVVSTYSLVYTTTTAYIGGVLAPNGDIHFVPFSGNCGQKVSAAGIVSTYPLAYTVLQAYFGGVLTPNGDIQFIPYSASVGQKISTNSGQPLGFGVCLSSFLNKF
jgi:hypothetical protein